MPGKAPLDELFHDLPFGPQALDSLPRLLKDFIGTALTVKPTQEGNDTETEITGRLLSVADEDGPKGQGKQHRLTVVTASGMHQYKLHELKTVRFEDEKARNQIQRALVGLAENKAKERRTLAVGFLGSTTRPVGFSYVVAAPVWKTAYRLVVSREGKTARLQGWAVVENLTGSDWEDVQLSLISGSPVALRQSLYTAFYTTRPQVAVESAATLIVPTKDECGVYDPTIEDGSALRYASNKSRSNLPRGPSVARGGSARSQALEASRRLRESGLLGGPQYEATCFDNFAAERDEEIPIPTELGQAAIAAQATEASTQVCYNFPAKIALQAGSSMMVPIIDKDIPSRQSWLYQPETNPNYPFAALKVTNDSGTALPAGIITAFDQTAEATDFVGDGQLPFLPKSASRFVTFALDTKTFIRRTDKRSGRSEMGMPNFGTLAFKQTVVRTITYEIRTPPEEDREIVIDEQREGLWTLIEEGDNQAETVGSRIRLAVPAERGKTTYAEIKLQWVEKEQKVGKISPSGGTTNKSTPAGTGTPVAEPKQKRGLFRFR